MDQTGQNFVDDLQADDVWFFPAGIPHSIQALDRGVELLLVFDDGSFSEDGTFLVSELFERNPKEILAKNFRTNLYIFPGTSAPANISKQNTTGPAGSIPPEKAYSYHLSQQQPYSVPGATVKIIDPDTFPIAKNFAAALFTIKPSAMHELHWHTDSDEWTFFLSGQGHVTVFDAPEFSRTFDFSAGDVDSHYVDNTGSETLVYLEVLQAGVHNDVVKDHLGVDDEFIGNLSETKQFILPGDKDLAKLDYSEEQL